MKELAVHLAHRQCDARDRPAIVGWFEIEARRPVIQALQSQTGIAQSGSCVFDEIEVSRQARAIIANRKVQLSAVD